MVALGIIGVVAAITMPVLINNHQKAVILAQLKEAYSILTNAIELAKNDNNSGITSDWGALAMSGKDTKSVSQDEYKNFVNNFVNKRFLPYLHVTRDFEAQNNKEMLEMYGYSGIKNPETGEVSFGRKWRRCLVLSNGMLLMFFITNSACLETDSDTGECLRRNYGTLAVYVDVNGYKGHNAEGKDVFLMAFDPRYGDLIMHGKQKNIDNCNTPSTVQYCGYIIQKAGWNFPDNYRWW